MYKNIIKLKRRLLINKLKIKTNISSKLINIIYYLKVFEQSIFSKFMYYFTFIILSNYFNSYKIVTILFICTLLGSINNTYLFKIEEYKRIIFNNYQIKSSYLIKDFYYTTIKNILLSFPFILIIFKTLSIKLEYTIYYSLFILNIKTIMNHLFIYIFKTKNIIHNDDDPNKIDILLNIIIILIAYPIIIFELNIFLIINIINILSIISHIYLLKYNYDDLINKLDFNQINYNLEENIKINLRKTKYHKNTTKYINTLFFKRHHRYIKLYIIRTIIITIIITLLYKEYENNLLLMLYFLNFNNKINELTYHKCDKYLGDYLENIIYKERIKTLMKYNIIFIIILLIRYKIFKYILLMYLVSLLFTQLNILLYKTLKPFINKNNNLRYYLFNLLITIIILTININNISIIAIYITTIILIIILNKYICKVN